MSLAKLLKTVKQDSILLLLFFLIREFFRLNDVQASIGIVFQYILKYKIIALILLIIVLLFASKYLFDQLLKLIKKIFYSRRWDLILLAALIFFLSYKAYSKGISNYLLNNYPEEINKALGILTPLNVYVVILSCISFMVVVLLILYALFLLKKFTPKKVGIFLSDEPIKDYAYDELGYSDIVEQFAQNIYNQGSNDTLVFALENIRGQGKTSFLNMLEQNNIIKSNCLVYRFNPWHFSSESDLLKKFLEGYSAFLSEYYFIGDLNDQLKDLAGLLSGTSLDVKGFGKLSLGFLQTTFNYKSVKQKINHSLSGIGGKKKILIVIDDLDRVPLREIKTVFRIIELCKDFYNTSFIICYDTGNFNAIDAELKITKTFKDKEFQSTEEELNNKYITSYLEKIVTIKYSLPDRLEKVKDFLTKKCIELYQGEDEESIKKYIHEPIKRLFDLGTYRIWGKYISNIRQVKRVINTLKMLHEFEEGVNILSEINLDDLIKIQVLYMHHNKVFDDLALEVGFTSFYHVGLMSDLEDYCKYMAVKKEGSNGYVMRKSLIYYLNQCLIEEKRLLEDIFDPDGSFRAKEVKFWNNLDYLKKVLSIATNDGETKSYIREIIKMNKIIEGFIENKNIDNAIEESVSFANQDKAKGITLFIEYFIKRLDKRGKEQKECAIIVIDYILNNFYIYPLNGLADCDTDIAKILEYSVGNKNYPESCSFIGKYMYGIGVYKANGILARLINNNWGVIGLYLALSLRKYAVRGTSLRNFQIGVTGVNDPNMNPNAYQHKFSRKVYELFKKQYISNDVNIFEEIIDLPLSKMSNEGMSASGIMEKKYLFSRTIYQLTSTKEIGYFDASGNKRENQKGNIRKQLNKYYFEKCFVGDKGVEYFIEYLFCFISAPHIPLEDEDKSNRLKFRYKGGEEGGFLDVIEENRFKNFLEENKKQIKNYINGRNEGYITLDGINKTYKELWKIVLRDVVQPTEIQPS